MRWLIVAAFLSLPLLATAATIHVPADYPTIQQGLDAAQVGDVVLVAPGSYSGAGNRSLSFGGKDVELRSEAGAAATVIDGGGDERLFEFNQGETRAALLEGFTIQNGMTDGGCGAGLRIDGASPTVRGCVVSGNVAPGKSHSPSVGGGICIVNGGAPLFEDCEIRSNDAWYAGGVWTNSAAPEFRNCIVVDNHGGLAGPATLESCTFSENEHFGVRSSMLVAQDCHILGNEIGVSLDGTATIANCVVAHNVGRGVIIDEGTIQITETKIEANGGGVTAWGGGPTVLSMTDCAVIANSAMGQSQNGGGALRIAGDVSVHLDRCVIADNHGWHGGGIYCSNGDVLLTNCTLYRNRAQSGGSALYVDGAATVALHNTIVAFHELHAPVWCNSAGATITTSCCDVYGNEVGPTGVCEDPFALDPTNFSLDPLFCGRDPDELGLSDSSPCAPANNPECGLVGALGVACGATSVEKVNWGQIKARYLTR